MSDEKPDEGAAERKAAPKALKFRALNGFSYPRPGGPVEIMTPGGKKVTSREIHVEAGAKGLVLPEDVAAELLAQGAIAKE